MISFSTTILRFEQQGEKTGWTYILVPAAMAEQLKAGNKKSFRVKGRLDEHSIKGVALIPMGGGDFILAVNAEMRKVIGKKKGTTVKVQLSVDEAGYLLNAALMECMADEPAAITYFRSLAQGHQNYFSKWIEGAKTEPTKVKRIAQAVSALSHKLGYPEMIRALKKEKDLLGGQ